MFNLRKLSQVDQAPNTLNSILDQTSDQLSGQPVATSDEILDDVDPQAQQTARDLAGVEFFTTFMVDLRQKFPEVAKTVESMPDYKELAVAVGQQHPDVLRTELEQYQQEGIMPTVLSASDMKAKQQMLMNRARSLSQQLQGSNVHRPFLQNLKNTFWTNYDAAKQSIERPLGNMAFNMSKHKVAQVAPLHSTEERIESEDAFVEKYLSPLLLFNGQRGPEDATSMAARDEILALVSPIAEENAESAIERIQRLVTNPGHAADELRKLYRELVAPSDQLSTQTGENTMASNNPDGIVKFNLTDHILNNHMASQPMTKEAADHFGQYYMLYGPSEKRICPKLRGKGGGYSGTGDVVSEYICRHHCLDGIVIDDNKTICGEALWRAHAMDKQSREYVDADGNIKGGYIEKRFEVNHNVPEENKMRLKPGETRKPRPASQGNIESRLQDMRNKEGQARDYRPDVNTGQPFEWCHDVDQNNVEATQEERERREQAMGHKTVNYTNKAEQENSPKQTLANKNAFNLKQFKTAQGSNIPIFNEGRPIDELLPNQSKRRMKKPIRPMNPNIRTKQRTAQYDIPDMNQLPGSNYTDPGNSPGNWNGGWLNGEWKCPNCGTMIGKNLKGSSPAALVAEHQKNCQGKQQDEMQSSVASPSPTPSQPLIAPAQSIGNTQAQSSFNLKSYKFAKEKGTTYKGEHFTVNPWAACSKNISKEDDPEKHHRCVMHVKEQDREKRKDNKDKDASSLKKK